MDFFNLIVIVFKMIETMTNCNLFKNHEYITNFNSDLHIIDNCILIFKE